MQGFDAWALGMVSQMYENSVDSVDGARSKKKKNESGGQADSGELPAGFGREKIAVAGADVSGGSDAGAAAQDHLAAHEFAVVFAERAAQGLEAGIGEIGAGGPLPAIAPVLADSIGGGNWLEFTAFDEIAGDGLGFRGCLPFEFGWQAMAGPAGVCVGFEVADLANGSVGDGSERQVTAKGEDGPVCAGCVAGLVPVEGRAPAIGLDGVPAGGEPELWATVAAVGDEGGEFGAGDEAVGERVRLKPDAMAGKLV